MPGANVGARACLDCNKKLTPNRAALTLTLWGLAWSSLTSTYRAPLRRVNVHTGGRARVWGGMVRPHALACTTRLVTTLHPTLHRFLPDLSRRQPRQVYDHANFLSPTGPERTTEPPPYTRVDMTPRPALMPHSGRLHRFPGRVVGFREPNVTTATCARPTI